MSMIGIQVAIERIRRAREGTFDRINLILFRRFWEQVPFLKRIDEFNFSGWPPDEFGLCLPRVSYSDLYSPYSSLVSKRAILRTLSYYYEETIES